MPFCLIVLLWTILIVAAVPAGGVALWAQTAAGCACMLAAFLLRWLPQCPPDPAGRRVFKRLTGSAFFHLFFVWVMVSSLLQWVQVSKTGVYGVLFPVSATLFLWSAWGCLCCATRRLTANRRFLRLLLSGIALLATVQAIFAVGVLYGSPSLYSRFVSGVRATGTFSSGNSLGGFLAIALPVTLMTAQLSWHRAWLHVRQRGRRLLQCAVREDYCLLGAGGWGMAVLLQAVALLLSGSRGAILSAGIALLLLMFWMVTARHDLRRGFSAMALLILITFVLALGAGGAYAVVLQRLKALEALPEVAVPRVSIWRGAVQMIVQHPLGVGPGRFPDVYPRYQPEGFGGARVYHAHNDYLELMAETGVSGIFLLLLGFGVLLFRSGRALASRPADEPVWLRRAALVAVAAGLMHAVVDFNLSSRPGVAVVFFCLLGVAAASPDRPVRTGLFRFALNKGIGLCLVFFCLALAVNQIRLATASILAEQGTGAVRGQVSLYHWLPRSSLPPVQAIRRLRWAVRLAPEVTGMRLQLAQALMAVHERQLTQMTRGIVEANPDLDESVARSQVRLLMRLEEREILDEALLLTEQALVLAPQDPDALAQAVWLRCRQLASPWAERITADQFHESVLGGVALARSSAPNDATVHEVLFRSLGLVQTAGEEQDVPVWRGSVRAEILDIGWHLLHIGSGRNRVLEQWNLQDIEPFDKETDHTPVSPAVAWSVYSYYERQRQDMNSLAALDLLERRLQAPAGSEADLQVWQLYRPLLVRERARWVLRQRRFADYRRAFQDREEALFLELSRTSPRNMILGLTGQKWRYDRLKSLFETRGLDSEHLRELKTLSVKFEGEARRFIKTDHHAEVVADGSSLPDHRLEMQLLGGRIEWVGLSVTEDAIQTFWRFRSEVPSDLQAVFVFLDSDFQAVASASFRFTRNFGTQFGSGAPDQGVVLETSTPIPVNAANSEHLRIGVRRLSTSRWLPSTEGLSFGELHHWRRLRSDGLY